MTLAVTSAMTYAGLQQPATQDSSTETRWMSHESPIENAEDDATERP